MADKTFQFCLPTGSSATDKFVLPTTTASSAHLQPGEEFVFTALCCPREIEYRSARVRYLS